MLLLCLLLAQLPATAQKKADDYFSEAGKYYEAGDFGKAASVFQYTANHFPKSKLHPLALYNSGIAYKNDGQDEKAIEVFTTIIKGNYNDMDKVGGNIMDDPYANYKHNSCELMSNIYFARGEYAKALEYFTLSDTTYPYNHFCGNELQDNEIHKVLHYADIYEKMGDEKRMLKALLQGIFLNNDEILNKTEPLIEKQKNARALFDTALKKIYVGKPHPAPYDKLYNCYYIKYLDTEIFIGNESVNGEKFNTAEEIESIKLSKFYRNILKAYLD